MCEIMTTDMGKKVRAIKTAILPLIEKYKTERVAQLNVQGSDGNFYEVLSIENTELGIYFMTHADYPCLELADDDEFCWLAALPTHKAVINPFYDHETGDSCRDQWFFIEL